MLLSSLLYPLWEFTEFIWWMQTQHQVAIGPHTRPSRSVSACRLLTWTHYRHLLVTSRAWSAKIWLVSVCICVSVSTRLVSICDKFDEIHFQIGDVAINWWCCRFAECLVLCWLGLVELGLWSRVRLKQGLGSKTHRLTSDVCLCVCLSVSHNREMY